MFKVLIIFHLIGKAFGANILFVTLVSSSSHHIWNEILVEGLLDQGHNITLIGHEKSKIQNDRYTVFEIGGAKDTYYQMVQVPSIQKFTAIENIFSVWDYNYHMCQHDLKSQALIDLMRSTENLFDLIVYDLHSGQCLYPLIEHFGTPPVIGVSAFGLPPFIADVMGAHIYSYIPFYSLPYSDKMTKLQRAYNSLLQTLDSIIKWCFYMPVMYKEAQKIFREDVRYFQEVEHSVSLLLTNNDPVLDYPQPFPPNIIPVGGLHVKKPQQLSEDLLNVIENSKNGVVYVSINTHLIANFMRKKTESMLVEVFSKLNHTVFWRYEEEIEDLPSNVVVRSWFPQNDILGNLKVKLFITHCGWLSIQEAIYHGVPLIGIPVFIDQENNAAKISSKRIGKTLDYTSLEVGDLYESITDILNNIEYSVRVARLSKLFKDQPQSPLQRAIFWMEYILRNNNSEHLSTAERYVQWYEKVSTEVLIITSLSLCLFVYAMHAIYLLIISAIKMNPTPMVARKSTVKKITKQD